MTFKRCGRSQAGLAAALASAALLGCGGQDAEPERAEEQSFEQRAQALAVQGGEGEPRTLSPTTAAQVQQRSREWAVNAMEGAVPAGSLVVVPPLYFGLAFAVEAAARGNTLATLREHLAPADPGVQAALQRGLTRSVRAGAAATFEPAFLDTVTATTEPGTWAALALQPLTAQQVQAEPHLRLTISDSVSGSWAWPQATAYEGVHRLAAGGFVKVPMLRVQGPVIDQTGPGYAASSMALGNGRWLVRVVPQGTPAAFGAAGLSTALAAIVPALNLQAAAGTTVGTWHLPATNTTQTAGLDDRRGMESAMDPIHANLRGLDRGGSYLRATPGSGALSVEASGVNYWASQSFEFIFNPQNVYNPNWSGGARVEWVNFGSLPACPTEAADLRPYFLALVQPGGSIAMLGRLDSHRSSPCGGLIVIPGTPSGP